MTVKDLLDKRISIGDVRTAVESFLREALSDGRRVDITRLASPEEGIREAEVRVWRPNATIQGLGLQTERPVLDQDLYVLRLDGDLNVVAYGLKEVE